MNTMTVHKATMSRARSHFAETLDAVAEGDVVIIERRGRPDAALVDAELLEDFLASVNPRIIKKIRAARLEVTSVPLDEAFAHVL